MGLSIEDVSHSYGRLPVVRAVSLRVARGEIACLLGPSGCGKTTLLRLAAGLEPLRQGRIAIGARTVADGAQGISLPPEARHVGLMFQDYALFPHLTVAGNIAFGLPRKDPRRQQLGHALQRMGLAAHADSYPHTLSGGQAQRCALLRALAPEPQVLLLDEPFSGLDSSRRAQVREQTLALLREAGVAALIVTHDPEEAMAMADRLWVMNDGIVVQSGSPAEVYLRPADPFVAALFGPLNRLVGMVRQGRIATPLGAIAAGGLPDGTAGQVLLRPEGVGVTLDAGGVGRIVAARLLGRCSHLQIAVDGWPQPLQALVPGIVLPPADTAVAVSLDPQQTFVFAA